jgi:hypothetical protein
MLEPVAKDFLIGIENEPIVELSSSKPNKDNLGFFL